MRSRFSDLRAFWPIQTITASTMLRQKCVGIAHTQTQTRTLYVPDSLCLHKRKTNTRNKFRQNVKCSKIQENYIRAHTHTQRDSSNEYDESKRQRKWKQQTVTTKIFRWINQFDEHSQITAAHLIKMIACMCTNLD